MKLYRNGYVVSEVKDNDYTYNVWPFEDVDDDKNAMMLTEEADNTWFLQYDMQHIVPDFKFVYKYFQYCQNNCLLYTSDAADD